MENKPIQVLYERKEDCCGCTACYAICPKGAITMLPDEEGVDYPLWKILLTCIKKILDLHKNMLKREQISKLKN